MKNLSEEYCVLMSLYSGENPCYFQIAMESILKQSLKPRQIVLVCDGPLTTELEKILSEIGKNFPSILCIVRTKENMGLGAALNKGLKYCKYEYIARMDTDDIARSDRCEKQLQWMQLHQLDLCSGNVQEFESDVSDPSKGLMQSVHRLPSSHKALISYAKLRNPMNHPCVMFRKSAVKNAGGYRSVPLFEDYDLWIRMIMSGAKLGNYPGILVYMRAGKELYCRRGGIFYCKNIICFFNKVKKYGFINKITYIQNIFLRCIVSLLPNEIRIIFYRIILRK